MDDFIASLTLWEIGARVLWSYSPVVVTTACYLPFLLTSLSIQTPGTARRTWLELGSSILVTMWALITVLHLIESYDAPHGHVYPQRFLLVGVDATFALGVVLLVATVRAMISRRLTITTGINVGNAAAIAAVYGNVVFALLLATPIE